jgi:anti-sigma factor RsiW
MNDEALRTAYQAAVSGRSGSRPTCPTPDAINALVAGEGSEADRLSVLRHVMECDACRREFELLRAVHAAGPQSRPVRRFHSFALAASVLVLVGLGTVVWTRVNTPANDTRRGKAAQVELVRPAAGAIVTPPLALVWHSVTGAQDYTAELLTPNGRLTRAWTTPDTSLTVPTAGDSGVAAGSYAWWVRAHLPDGSEQHSLVLRFELRR